MLRNTEGSNSGAIMLKRIVLVKKKTNQLLKHWIFLALLFFPNRIFFAQLLCTLQTRQLAV